MSLKIYLNKKTIHLQNPQKLNILYKHSCNVFTSEYFNFYYIKYSTSNLVHFVLNNIHYPSNDAGLKLNGVE